MNDKLLTTKASSEIKLQELKFMDVNPPHLIAKLFTLSSPTLLPLTLTVSKLGQKKDKISKLFEVIVLHPANTIILNLLHCCAISDTAASVILH